MADLGTAWRYMGWSTGLAETKKGKLSGGQVERSRDEFGESY